MDLISIYHTIIKSRLFSIKYFTYYSIILINTLFFSGYYILKVPLTLVLESEGLALKEAYSISTSANILLAISSIYFGLSLHNCIKKKFALYVGLLLCVISIYIFSLKIYSLTVVAVGLYVLGGGLYFFNLIMFINKQFTSAQTRLKGNYIYLIFVNIAGTIGCLLYLSQLHEENIFKYCLISCIAALIIFTLLYPKMECEEGEKNDLKKFFCLLLILLLGIIYILQHTEMLRWLVIFSFLIATLYIFCVYCYEQDIKLLFFVSLVYLFNIPYWIANTLIFNELIYFVSTDVSSIKGFNPALLIILDPLINTIFGLIIFIWYQNRSVNHNRNLTLSTLLIGAAFLVITFGLFINKGTKLSYFYPLFTIILFSCGEFFLQSTLNARVRDLLSHKKRSEFLGTGMLRSSRAFAHVAGYYLITILTLKHRILSNKIMMKVNLNLYLCMLGIIFFSFIGFNVLKKTKLKSIF